MRWRCHVSSRWWSGSFTGSLSAAWPGNARGTAFDSARAKRYQKRGGGGVKVAFSEDMLPADEKPTDLVALDDALNALADMDERRGRVIEFRFFGGLTVEETATVLKVSPDTVMRDSQLAKAWLTPELSRGNDHDARALETGLTGLRGRPGAARERSRRVRRGRVWERCDAPPRRAIIARPAHLTSAARGTSGAVRSCTPYNPRPRP